MNTNTNQHTLEVDVPTRTTPPDVTITYNLPDWDGSYEVTLDGGDVEILVANLGTHAEDGMPRLFPRVTVRKVEP